jgi:hypothetical protein
MSEKQKIARINNWNIKTVRGCYALIDRLPINTKVKQAALTSINLVLVELHADTELIHRQKERLKHLPK